MNLKCKLIRTEKKIRQFKDIEIEETSEEITDSYIEKDYYGYKIYSDEYDLYKEFSAMIKDSTQKSTVTEQFMNKLNTFKPIILKKYPELMI